ncbi:MAG: helix-turn-helix domain-containing protein [Verrucomicrobiae bacterium]|nr:helix-turn-helix domain-containing protein [Verrucomicrobiae bacterium]
MNILTVNEQQSIRTLAERGWSRRRIARELGLHRETVGRYLGPAGASTGAVAAGAAKPAIPPAGSADSEPANPGVTSLNLTIGPASAFRLKCQIQRCDPGLATGTVESGLTQMSNSEM